MARKSTSSPLKSSAGGASRGPAGGPGAQAGAQAEGPPAGGRRRVLRGLAGLALAFLALVLLYRVVPPPTTLTILSESRRLGGVERDWVDAEQIASVMLRAVVAAEDANFCAHWGFDMAAIRTALDDGATRGASTLSQQVAKNVFLWQGRSWGRKALEALITPVIELLWPKRRILEIYLNVAEFGEGIFGVKAAAAHYFGKAPADLSAREAARLAAALPDPKSRDPAHPSAFLRRRAGAILDGAETIRRDGRAACLGP